MTRTGRPKPGPEGEETLADVLDRFRSLGHRAQFRVEPPASVACLECHAVSEASDVSLLDLVRLEGTSDPADEMGVALLSCPECRATGTLTLYYGPSAPAEHGAVLRRLRDERAPHAV
ncbi:MAG: hypothetical protein ACT4PT_12780 [Methanobacteriota archaeon]